MPEAGDVRVERDTMGEVQVPSDAYYGAQTARGVENFPIGELRMPTRFIRALGMLKQAAAEANRDLGLLDTRLAEAIARAAGEVADGTYGDQFPIGVFQTGSGTSTNMNANEVIASRANELLGGDRRTHGEVHPNDHVNAGQSSNDVIPTALHLAAILALQEEVIPALSELEAALRRKACELWPVIKTGRTHLQDATPIRLGQELLGYADQMAEAVVRLHHSVEDLSAVALGGTAVGTGINTHPEFPTKTLARISGRTGLPLRETTHHFAAQSSIDSVVAASGMLRTSAVALIKIANDLRWMSSGPVAGLGEITLPELQPGSSIMPGKVNPVVAESLIMVAMQVIGYDATISLAGQSGSFELNVALPIVAYDFVTGAELLADAVRNLARRAVEGLQATSRGPEMVEKGFMLVTALSPAVGYDTAAAIAKEAYRTGRTVRELALEKTDLPREEIDRLLDPAGMVGSQGPVRG